MACWLASVDICRRLAGHVDWRAWHEDYEDPNSALGQRLVLVQMQVLAALGRAAPGPVKVISVCAGQRHDLVDLLRGSRCA